MQKKILYIACVPLLTALLIGSLLTLLAPRLNVAAQSADRPDGAADSDAIAARVYFSGTQHFAQIVDVADVWHVNAAESFVVVQTNAAQADWFRAQGYGVELDEVRTARLDELALMANGLLSAAQQDGIPGFVCYRTVEETYADMVALAAEHPTLASWIDIGDSWDKVQYEVVLSEGITDVADLPQGYDLHALVLTNETFTPTFTTVMTNVITSTVTVTPTVTPTDPLTETVVVTEYVPISTTTTVPKADFFLLASIHARELTPAETATRFAEELVAGYGTDADITWLLDYNRIHIVSQGNPDGRKFAEQLESWRKNTNTTDSCIEPGSSEPYFPYYGVDLNRNSSFRWNECEGFGCSSNNSCRLTFRGDGPASEPETQALQAYMREIFADQRGPQLTDAAPLDTTGLMISMHSYSELILYPWGFRPSDAPNGPQLRTLANKFGYYTGYRACQSGAPGCIYQTDGTTDDWSYGELGVSSFTFELGTQFFETCNYFEETVLDEVMPSLLYAAKSARLPYMSPAGPETLRVAVDPSTSGAQLVVSAQADDTRFDSNGSWLEPTQKISGARVSIDAPAWITGTTVYTMTAADGLFDEKAEGLRGAIDVADLADGQHTVFVQSQDADGNWGVASALFFTLPTEVVFYRFMPFMPHVE